MVFIWLLLYGVVMLFAHRLSFLTSLAVPIGLGISAVTLWLLIKRRGVWCGFGKPQLAFCKKHLFFLPFLVPIVYRLAAFGWQPQSAASVVSIFFAAMIEEMLFRGILLQYLSRRNRLLGIALSALAFAAAHLLNLTNGATAVFVLCQVLLALVVGVAFAGIALTCDSLLPCIGIHFLFNLTAPASPSYTSLFFWLCIVVYAACGINGLYILFTANPTKKGCSYETLH